jgi:hypothetical protein
MRDVAVLHREIEPTISGITNRNSTGNPNSSEPVWYEYIMLGTLRFH